MKEELDDLELKPEALALASEYADDWYRDDLNSPQRLGKERARKIAKEVSSLSGKPLEELRFLDLGAGRGRFILDFRQAGVQAFGVERNAYSLKSCYEPIKPYMYLMDITNTQILGEGSFDIIYTNTINELCKEDRSPFFKEIYRLLSKNGLFVFIFPEREIYEYWMNEAPMKREKYTFFRGGNWVSRNEVMQLADMAGFDLFKSPPIENMLNGELSDDRCFTWYLFKKL